MANKVRALLFDTRSIQKYIYAGNRLRTNVGASHLVTTVYQDVLRSALANIFGADNVDMVSWKQERDRDFLQASGRAQVAYEGGGNCLLLLSVDSEEAQKQVVADFTAELLVQRPGLHIGAALGEIDVEDNDSFQLDLDALYKELKRNQQTIFPRVNTPYTGLTVPCPETGGAADGCAAKGSPLSLGTSGQHFFSREAISKAEAAEAANEALRERFGDICKDYAFPNSFDDLGQKEGKNYIAIVHIDGNNMGEKFRECKNLEERSKLSDAMSQKTQGAFGKLLDDIEGEYASYEGFLELRKSTDGKPFLPIRPLIIGGDDITFVCAGEMALTYARRLIELMEHKKSAKGIADKRVKRMDCCGGVAILKTSYPFFRGYELAEQLCEAAKKKMREKREKDGSGSSWLDFAILHGEQAPELEAIRAQEYKGARGAMHFGPYRVSHKAESKDEHSHDIEKLYKAVARLQGSDGKPPCMSHGKVKQLRQILARGEHEMQLFLQQLARMGEWLPFVEGWEKYCDRDAEDDTKHEIVNSCWYKGETPYVDAIEMMEFIPQGIKVKEAGK